MKKKWRLSAAFFAIVLAFSVFPSRGYATDVPGQFPETKVMMKEGKTEEQHEEEELSSVSSETSALESGETTPDQSSFQTEEISSVQDEKRFGYFTSLRPKSESSETESSEVPILPNDVWNQEYDATLSLACDWLTNFGQGELYYFCMGAAGIPAPAKTVTKYIADVSLTPAFENILTLQYTVLNTTFCGYSAENILGKNLIHEIGRYEYYDLENLQTIAYALLALDCNRYAEEETGANNRSTLRNQLLLFQNKDGGFAPEIGEESSPVETALALTALASYTDQEDVIAAIRLGLQYLEQKQQSDGTFLEDKEESSVAISKTIIALISLGIPVTDPEFMKEGETLDQILMRYVKVDGGFSTVLGQPSNNVATENAILAMIALKNQRNPYLLTTKLESVESLSDGDIAGKEGHSWSSLLSKRNLYLLLAVVGILLLIFVLIRLFWHPEEDSDFDEWVEQEDTADKDESEKPPDSGSADQKD